MNAPEEGLAAALLRAVGYTLLHSLWQGAVVALSVAILLLVLHRHRAAVRYRVLLGGLVLLVVLAAGTFGSCFHLNPPVAAGTARVTAAPQARLFEGEALRPAGLVDQLALALAVGTTYVERNLPLLVGAWLLGILGMALRLLAGLGYVRRLRRYRVAALPDAWQQRLDALCTQAGLSRRVQLLASALVPSPVVVGYAKPVILLPLSAATGLAAHELELILAHEVAHVLRQDYLVNLLQAVAEVLFFYHPAVWFLSAGLRTEREHCCDDVATQLCGDPRALAQALSSLAELAYADARTPRLVLAATGPTGASSLLRRVRRLVAPQPAEPTLWEGFWATCVMLLSAGLLVGSLLVSRQVSAHPVGQVSAEEQVYHRTPADLLEAAMKRDGLLPNPHQYEYTLRANSFVLNGEAQPARIAHKYRRLYEVLADERMWPLVSSLYRHVHDDEAPATDQEQLSTP